MTRFAAVRLDGVRAVWVSSVTGAQRNFHVSRVEIEATLDVPDLKARDVRMTLEPTARESAMLLEVFEQIAARLAAGGQE